MLRTTNHKQPTGLYVICCCSVAKLCPTLRPHGLQHTRLLCPSLFPQSLLKFMSFELVMLSNHLILCRPLLLLPSISPSIRIFYNVTPLRKAYMSCTNPSGNI